MGKKVQASIALGGGVYPCGYINVEYHEGTFLPDDGLDVEEIELSAPIDPHLGYTATKEGEDFWTYLWVNTRDGYCLFRNRTSSRWTQEDYTQAMDMINAIIFYNDSE